MPPQTHPPQPALPVAVLPWDQPLAGQAAAFLARTTGWDRRGPLDLSASLVIVSTRQSGRRLREALAKHAGAHGQAVLPPRVVLPEELIGNFDNDNTTGTPDAATRHESLLTWAQILLDADLAEFPEVFPIAPPARTFTWAARLAREFQRLQATLAENGLRMADVPGAVGGPFPEAARWNQLAALERRCDAALTRAGKIDPQAARIRWAAQAPPPPGIERIHILATPDPHPIALRLLARWCRALPVSILVHASATAIPEQEFDAWGRPRNDHWERRPFAPGPFESCVHLCADPSAQAERMVEAIRAAVTFAGGERSEAFISVGLSDPEIAPPLRHALARFGRPVFDPEGKPRKTGALHHLLAIFGRLARDPAFTHAAAFARCPDTLAWLARECGVFGGFSPARFLAGLDESHSRHLPATLAEARRHAGDHAVDFPELAPALELIAGLHASLRSAAFADAARDVPARIFGGRDFDLERPADARVVDAAHAWSQVCREVAGAARHCPGATLPDLWDIALQAFGETVRFEEKLPDAVELQGWLELPWDDSPHLLVAGLNDGRVPSAVVGDAFLPERLREQLGLKTNAARLARDAYILHAVVAARSGHGRCDLLLGKTSAAGDPLRPSRLLLACPDAELPRRVKFLFREVEAGRATIPWSRAWPLRPAAPPQPIVKMPVTGFRSFLACPFRFYLRHGLRMEEVDPHKAELDARDFGNLVHHAVEAMGRETPLRGVTDAAVLRGFLLEKLDGRVQALYGPRPPLPVTMQVESARQRLSRAAEVQAALHADGWEIEQVETPVSFHVGSILVRARIDRIDVHRDTGARRVIDYKTSDRPVDPAAAHLRKPKRDEDMEALADYARFESGGGIRIWEDLQLPLYLHALAGKLDGTVSCGYFNLPKAANETALQLWDGYTQELQEAAWKCAEGIAVAVAAGRFWPPAEQAGRFDDFAAMFHQGVAESVEWPAVAGRGAGS